jgi:hypothetical protein
MTPLPRRSDKRRHYSSPDTSMIVLSASGRWSRLIKRSISTPSDGGPAADDERALESQHEMSEM